MGGCLSMVGCQDYLVVSLQYYKSGLPSGDLQDLVASRTSLQLNL